MAAGDDRGGVRAPRTIDEPERPEAPPVARRPPHERIAAPDPERGDVVGGYRLLSVLGRGGAGTVFKALHLDSGRVVALKVLAAAKARRARIVQRFFDEVRAASAVRHSGLVEVYDFIEEERPRRLAYAMEHIDGPSLRERLRREGALDLRVAIAIGTQICEALSALHRAGIIHRDLKPENILLVGDAQRPFVKLVDFGVAKFLPVDRTAGNPDPTLGTFVGTPRYMAPEQAAGAAVDHRADLFAVGVMLFEMITGTCPHEGDSLRDVVLAKLKGAPRITINPEQEILPQELTDVVDACLRLKPSLRPASATRVAAALVEVEVVLFAVGRPVRAAVTPAASHGPTRPPPEPPVASAPAGFEPSPPDGPDPAPRPGARRGFAPASSVAERLPDATADAVTFIVPAAPLRGSGEARRALKVLALVVIAVALGVLGRWLTQKDAVLVLPDPDPPSRAGP